MKSKITLPEPDSSRIARRAVLVAGAATLTGLQSIGAHAAAPLGTSGVVFTADEAGGSISAVALPSGRVRSVPLPIMPHNVQVAPDGRTVLVVGMGMAAGHGAGRLLILDASDIARPRGCDARHPTAAELVARTTKARPSSIFIPRQHMIVTVLS